MQITAIIVAGALAITPAAAVIPANQQQSISQIDIPVASSVENPESTAPKEEIPIVAEEKKPEVQSNPVASTEKNYSVVLGEYTTTFSTVNSNRCTNLKLASDAMNGNIVEPGAEFSFNTVVGKRSSARGYKSAPVISGGKYVDGIGGGVCQISTTLFNAALEGNMKITSRRAHSKKSSYVPAGRDATVSYGSVDFKFSNPYSQPVKIVTNYNSSGSIRIAIMGPEGSAKPWVKIKVTNNGKNSYTLTRTYGDKVNYTTNSKYS